MTPFLEAAILEKLSKCIVVKVFKKMAKNKA
jgi:hypothetical protein